MSKIHQLHPLTKQAFEKIVRDHPGFVFPTEVAVMVDAVIEAMETRMKLLIKEFPYSTWDAAERLLKMEEEE